jgi:hypothetical protein
MNQPFTLEHIKTAAAVIVALVALEKSLTIRTLAKGCRHLSTSPKPQNRKTQRIFNLIDGWSEMIFNYALALPFYAFCSLTFLHAWFFLTPQMGWRHVLCLGMTFIFVILSTWAKFAGDRGRYALKKLGKK